MPFQRQSTTGKFVSWGKPSPEKKENSYVVKEGEYIECFVQKVKGNEKFGLILEVKIEELEEPLLITGTTILNKELGYEWTDDENKGDMDELLPIDDCAAGYRVEASDKIRIHFDGMIKTKKGPEAYNLWVEVDR